MLIATISTLCCLLPFILSAPYDTNLYSLGSNLVNNSMFSKPTLTTAFQYYSFTELGWTCNDLCQLCHIPRRCAQQSATCNVSFTQALDVDTVANRTDSIYQNLTIASAGQYYFRVVWMPCLLDPIGKDFAINFNSTRHTNIIINDSLFIDHVYQTVVNLTVGTLKLEFVESGSFVDPNGYSYGTYIGIVEMFLLIEKQQSSAENTTNINQNQIATMSDIFEPPYSSLSGILFENITLHLNTFPGNRIFTETLSNYLVTFDRLQFYYLHKQNLSHYSYILLSNSHSLALDRGSLVQSMIEKCQYGVCRVIVSTYSQCLEFVEYKSNYTEAAFLEKNPNGIGFFSNNLDFFFYELPVIILTYLIFLFAFKRLFNYRISKYIRKYSFYGILLFIVYEGNVEHFTFYFFTECRNLFSINFSHKLANVFMIYFFFLLMVFSIGGLLFFTFNYRKLVKYFMEDSVEYNMEAIVLESFERSVFPLIFGAVHALFIDNLFVQTVILFVVESLYFLVKLRTLKSVTPRYKFKVSMCIVSSLLRLIFIVTFYLYQNMNKPEIINLIHYQTVILYLLCWISQFLHDCVMFLSDIKEATTSLCKSVQKTKNNDKNINKQVSKDENKKKDKSKQKMKQNNKQQSKPKSLSKLQPKQQSKKNNDQNAVKKSMQSPKEKKMSKDKSKDKTKLYGTNRNPLKQGTNIIGTINIRKPKDISQIPNILIQKTIENCRNANQSKP